MIKMSLVHATRLLRKTTCLVSSSVLLTKERLGNKLIPLISWRNKSRTRSWDHGLTRERPSAQRSGITERLALKEMTLAESPQYLRISLDAIENNLSILRSHCAPNTDVIAVVKANAYGHGSIGVSKFLKRCGISQFAVATALEGTTLRLAGVKDTILVFGSLNVESMPRMYRHKLVPSLTSVNSVDLWMSGLQHLDAADLIQYPVVIKVDSGLSRFGCYPDGLERIVERCFEYQLPIHSIMTHLSEKNGQHSISELDRFLEATRRFRDIGIKVHASGSGPVLHGLGGDLDFIRPGFALYGQRPVTDYDSSIGLQPALSWMARPSTVKAARRGQRVGYKGLYTVPVTGQRIATFNLGYADGYNDALTNAGSLSDLEGRLFPVIGQISMDAMVAQASDNVTESTVFHVIKDDYTSENSLISISKRLGTTPVAFCTHLCYRIPRVFTFQNRVQSITTLDAEHSFSSL